MDIALDEVLVFKLFRAETATGTVTTPPIVIALDIINYRFPHGFPTDKAFTVDIFDFKRVEEALRTGYAVSGAPDNLLSNTAHHDPCEMVYVVAGARTGKV